MYTEQNPGGAAGKSVAYSVECVCVREKHRERERESGGKKVKLGNASAGILKSAGRFLGE